VRGGTERKCRQALLIVAIAAAMAGIFAGSYSLALGRGAPHHITVGLVGRAAQGSALIGALERTTGDGLSFRPYGSAGAAREAISQQATYAALVLGAGRPGLLVSGASGASVTQVLKQGATRVTQGSGEPLRTTDLHPLPPADPQGLVSFYATLAASIVGFVTMFHLRANVAGSGSAAGWSRSPCWLSLVA
jgi:hypothetical protein